MVDEVAELRAEAEAARKTAEFWELEWKTTRRRLTEVELELSALREKVPATPPHAMGAAPRETCTHCNATGYIYYEWGTRACLVCNLEAAIKERDGRQAALRSATPAQSSGAVVPPEVVVAVDEEDGDYVVSMGHSGIAWTSSKELAERWADRLRRRISELWPQVPAAGEVERLREEGARAEWERLYGLIKHAETHGEVMACFDTVRWGSEGKADVAARESRMREERDHYRVQAHDVLRRLCEAESLCNAILAAGLAACQERDAEIESLSACVDRHMKIIRDVIGILRGRAWDDACTENVVDLARRAVAAVEAARMATIADVRAALDASEGKTSATVAAEQKGNGNGDSSEVQGEQRRALRGAGGEGEPDGDERAGRKGERAVGEVDALGHALADDQQPGRSGQAGGGEDVLPRRDRGPAGGVTAPPLADRATSAATPPPCSHFHALGVHREDATCSCLPDCSCRRCGRCGGTGRVSSTARDLATDARSRAASLGYGRPFAMPCPACTGRAPASSPVPAAPAFASPGRRTCGVRRDPAYASTCGLEPEHKGPHDDATGTTWWSAPAAPAPGDVPLDGSHVYTSTACLHGFHGRCRRTCKFCTVPCLCDCHEAKAPAAPARPHLIDGEFQSDKYPTCPRGKVPLSTKDPTAQDLLWTYAQRRRAVDAEFADDLEEALRLKGYAPAAPEARGEEDDLEARVRAELKGQPQCDLFSMRGQMAVLALVRAERARARDAALEEVAAMFEKPMAWICLDRGDEEADVIARRIRSLRGKAESGEGGET